MTLAQPRFATTKLTEGYDVGEVDDLVDRVLAALAQEGPAMTAEQVRDVRFTPVRLREGYAMGDVDDWLDQAVVALRAQASGVPPEVAAPDTGAAYVPAAPRPDAIARADDRSTRVAMAWGLAVVAVVLLLVAVL
ncbi:DivIVA domain-containing protein [Nocardioides zeicaulis]|uniref:DivIVA domain-containing protein n=1 Tax=Nocardioides zeicaulis TaxID=1776857 RepID=A0ABV6DZI2_9ACTN